MDNRKPADRRNGTVITNDRGVRTAYVFDIDGVLCNNQQLLHDFLATNPTAVDWAEVWYPKIDQHPRNEGWAHLAIGLWWAGYTIILLTARPALKREATMRWLDLHGIPYDLLVMREEHHEHHDTKTHNMEWILKEYKVALAIDDDPIFISEYERLGVPSIHAHNGLNT